MNNQVSGEEQVEIQKSRELEGIPLFCNVLYLDTEGIFHKNLCCEESKRIQWHSAEGRGSLKVAAVVQGCADRCYPCQVWQSGTVIPLHQRGAQLCSVISFTMRLYFIFYAIFYIMFVAPKLNCTWLVMESWESVAVTGRCVIPTTEMYLKAQGIMSVKSLVL